MRKSAGTRVRTLWLLLLFLKLNEKLKLKLALLDKTYSFTEVKTPKYKTGSNIIKMDWNKTDIFAFFSVLLRFKWWWWCWWWFTWFKASKASAKWLNVNDKNVTHPSLSYYVTSLSSTCKKIQHKTKHKNIFEQVFTEIYEVFNYIINSNWLQNVQSFLNFFNMILTARLKQTVHYNTHLLYRFCALISTTIAYVIGDD